MKYQSQDRDTSYHQDQSEKKEFTLYQRDYLSDLRQSQQRLTVQELENKVVMLVTENERLQDMLRDKSKEIEILLEEQQMLQESISHQKDEKFKNLENKATKMIFENEKILLMNQSLQLQLEEMQYQYTNLQSRIQVDTQAIEEKWKTHYYQQYEGQQLNLQQNIDKLIKELKHSGEIISQYEDKINFYSKEAQMSKDQAEFKAQKCNELLNNNQQLTNILQQQELNVKNLQDKNSQLNKQVDKLYQELNNYKHTEQYFQNDIDERRMKFEELIIQYEELKIVEQESKQQLMKNDQEFRKYEQEIQEMKHKFQDLQQKNQRQQQDLLLKHQKEISNLKNQLQELIQENEELSKITISLKNDLNNEKQKSSNAQQIVQLNEQEIKQKEDILNSKQKEIEAQKMKFEKLFQENNNYLQQQQHQYEIKLLQNQQNNKMQMEQILIQKEKEISSLNDRINVLLAKIDEQSQYIQQLSFSTNEKSEEIEESRPQIQSLKNELHRLQQLTVEQSNEIDSWKLKVNRMEDNFEMQQADQMEKISKLQEDLQSNRQKIQKITDEYNKQQNNLQESLSTLSKVQQLLQEAHQQIKFYENKIELLEQELVDYDELKKQIIQIKEKHQIEIDNLKRAFDSNFKVKIDKEIAIEREKLENYAIGMKNERISLENQIQNLTTENMLLKNEINQQTEYFKLQIQDMIVDQQKHILNIDHSYKLELKGLNEVQQVQFNSIICQLQNQINQLYQENQQLILCNNKQNKQLRKSEKKQSIILQEMDDRIHSLEQDNERLIEEKAKVRSKNTFLQTQLKRTSTPIRERSISSYYNRRPSPYVNETITTIKRPTLSTFDLYLQNY